MAKPSSLALSAICLLTSDRSCMPSVVKLGGMPFKVLLPSLPHYASVPAECFWVALLDYPVPRWDLSLLGAGGPFRGCLGHGPTKRHIIHGLWGGVLPFGPGGALRHQQKRSCWSRQLLGGGGSLCLGEKVGLGCLPHQYVVGGY